MPYLRKKRYRKRKKGSSPGKKALKMVKQIKSAIELKFIDTAISNNDVDFNGNFAPAIFNNPTQGLTDSNRVGDTIKVISCRWRHFVRRNNSSACGIRYTLIWDKYNTVANINDLYASNGAQDSLISDYVKDKRGDYIVLHDETVQVASDYRTKTIGYRKRRINKKTQFQAGSTVFEKGALKLWAISDVDSNAGNQPQADFYIRVYYMDA